MGSILLFLCCLAFARVSARVRVTGVSIIAAYKFHLGQWIGWLFLMGMLLAELRHFRAQRPALRPVYRRVLTVGSAVMLFPTLFFASWPFNGNVSECVGFKHFAYTQQPGAIEPVRFFLGWAGVAFVTILENLPWLQAFFNTSAVLYLGDISYSLYLVHWMCAAGWSKHVALRMFAAGYTKLSACLTSLVLTGILAVWMADLLWRFGDAQSVRFARWSAKRLGI
jgi:peptidoglycan/LPS O-acetylase OafA/YrhL